MQLLIPVAVMIVKVQAFVLFSAAIVSVVIVLPFVVERGEHK